MSQKTWNGGDQTLVELETWSERLLDATSLEAVFQP